MTRVPLGAGERIFFQGGAGRIEAGIDAPPRPAPPQRVALVAHPHPVYGGTLGNKAAQTLGKVRINMAGCLDRCDEGPCMVVYPDAVWYTYVDRSDIDEIIDEHLKHGRVVRRLCI